MATEKKATNEVEEEVTQETKSNYANKRKVGNLIDELAADMDNESMKFHSKVGIARDNTLYELLKSYIKRLGELGEEAKKRNVKAPAVIVIGEVATLGEKLSWFKKSSR